MTYLMVKKYLYFIYKASCTKYLCFFTDVGTKIVKKENDTVFFTKAPFFIEESCPRKEDQSLPQPSQL